MHMADALVSPVVAATMYTASTAVTGFSIKKLHIERETKTIPLMGVMSAFVFAAQMINFSIPGTGSSGHLTGGLLLSAILGPYAGFLSMVTILFIQSLLFADGGLLALGCNIWNMAFYSCFVGYFLIYKMILKKGLSKRKIFIASVLSCVVSLQLGSFSVTLETLASSVTELPFSTFLSVMQPIHFAIGIVEGFITASVLLFLYQTRPELIDAYSNHNKISFKKMLTILLLVTIFIGGGLSFVASSNPDGLEWSIQKSSTSSELKGTDKIHEKTKELQKNIALLPDYTLKENQKNPFGTSLSGIFGAAVVAVVSIGGCYIFKRLKKK